MNLNATKLPDHTDPEMDDPSIDEEVAQILEESSKDSANQAIPVTQDEINEFIDRNRKLIHTIIKPYRGLDVYDDLYQEAALGFFKGIQTYDPRKNSKLTTYAFACGKNEVKMYLRKASAKSRTGTVISLDATIGADPDGDTMLNRDLESMDPNTDVPTFEEQIHTRTMFQTAMSIVRHDMSHNQQVVIQRYLEGIPQSQTAKELHTSQSEISKLYKTSICELRLKMEKLGYIDRS